MQLLESSMLGLRAARLALRNPRTYATVTLLPVVHIGDQTFYDAIHADALAHDVVLIEGVRSPISRRMTRAYRWINTTRLGLVVQPRLVAPAEGVRVELADLSAEEFAAEWRRVSIWLRFLLTIGAPLFGLWQRLFATLSSIARRLDLEDRRSSDELLSWSPRWSALDRAILDARDARLISHLVHELEKANDMPVRIAVIFGARHMRAVLAELSRRGFVGAGSDWREAISLL